MERNIQLDFSLKLKVGQQIINFTTKAQGKYRQTCLKTQENVLLGKQKWIKRYLPPLIN